MTQPIGTKRPVKFKFRADGCGGSLLAFAEVVFDMAGVGPFGLKGIKIIREGTGIKPYFPTAPVAVKCESCGIAGGTADRYCRQCGKRMHPATDVELRRDDIHPMSAAARAAFTAEAAIAYARWFADPARAEG